MFISIILLFLRLIDNNNIILIKVIKYKCINKVDTRLIILYLVYTHLRVNFFLEINDYKHLVNSITEYTTVQVHSFHKILQCTSEQLMLIN